MELHTYKNGEILLHIDDNLEARYPRTTANQLIRSARMSDWNGFSRMWEKKTDSHAWQIIESNCASLDAQQRWKIKEAFARLTTVEDETLASTNVIEKTLALL